MNLLVGAINIGLILALVALGIVISYRVLDALDLTTDGSFATGAALAAMLITRGVHPFLATCLGGIGGAIAGTITGILHTSFRIHILLAGVLTSTALYSADLYIMRGGNLTLGGKPNLFGHLEEWIERLVPALARETDVSTLDWVILISMILMVAGIVVLLAIFFRTNLGMGMRATGSNPRMAKALGINTGRMIVLGLMLANGLIGLAGALFAEYSGFANVQMGVGMVVTGLASVILGESLFRWRTVGRQLAAGALGAVLFRLIVAAALRAGLDPNALKLVTAVFVLGALVLPDLFKRTLRGSRPARAPADG
jgi:putative ABC transport system permease protein